MPAGLIDEKGRMGARRNFCRDLGQMQVHCFDVAGRQNEPGALALPGADSPEYIGRCRALILGSARTRAALGPSPRNLVLLPDARFVGEPYF